MHSDSKELLTTKGILHKELNFYLENMENLKDAVSKFSILDRLTNSKVSLNRFTLLKKHENSKYLNELSIHKNTEFKENLRMEWMHSAKFNLVHPKLTYVKWLNNSSNYNFFFKFLKLNSNFNKKIKFYSFDRSTFIDRYFFNYFYYFKVFKHSIISTSVLSKSSINN